MRAETAGLEAHPSTDGWLAVRKPPWEQRMALPGKGVDVWICRVPEEPAERSGFEEVLSVDELGRSRRFFRERDRRLYVVSHGLLRLLLGAYSGFDPREIRFSAGRWGKPAVQATAGGPPPSFNMAHSGDMVLLGFSGAGGIGVDIERQRRLGDPLGIASRFFSDGEAAILAGMGPEDRSSAFFRLWARKEATVKALGLSVARLSREVELLPLDPRSDGRGSVLIRGEGGPASAVRWLDLPMGPGYSAALATAGGGEFACLRELHLPA